jgi:hydrogenase nickel incorporation protein HypA/HybF
MHELPVTERILDIVLKHAEQNRVRRIVSITLSVGELSDLEDQWMQHYFDYLSKQSPAEGARLKIERIPIVVRCTQCSETRRVAKEALADSTCPACGSGQFLLVSGREYHIKEMEAQ